MALWIYEKFSKWSKKWFTHIFLALVMLIYSMVNTIWESLDYYHVQVSSHRCKSDLCRCEAPKINQRILWFFLLFKIIGGSLDLHGRRRLVFHLHTYMKRYNMGFWFDSAPLRKRNSCNAILLLLPSTPLPAYTAVWLNCFLWILKINVDRCGGVRDIPTFFCWYGRLVEVFPRVTLYQWRNGLVFI